jgi:hypothetical protein
MDLNKDEFITDDLFLNSLIAQLTTKPDEKELNNFDFSKLNYNDFFKDNAEEIIKRKLNIKLNDPYINLIIQNQIEEIEFKTPLEDWKSINFTNNNNNENSNEKDITYLR